MRLIPLLTASLVLVALYLLVMERPMLLALAGAASAQSAPAAAPEAPPPADPVALRVVVQTISERPVDQAVVLRGRTEAARRVEVRAQTQGLVATDPLPRGTRVTADQVLCELDPGTRAAMLTEAEARLAEAEINFSAATRLSEGGFAAQTRVASAEAAVRAAQAGVEAARAELGRLTIRAPFAGVIEEHTAERGGLLSPGGLCATVIVLDPLVLVGFAAEAQIDRVAEGALAGGRLSNGRDVVGQVTFVARSADPATRTFRVEVTVPNTDLTLREGMSADILVQAPAQSAHLVPGSALTLNDDGRLGVKIVDAQGISQFTEVQLVRDTGDGFWVRGLPPTVDVIVVGQEFVGDGVPVQAVHRPAPEAQSE